MGTLVYSLDVRASHFETDVPSMIDIAIEAAMTSLQTEFADH